MVPTVNFQEELICKTPFLHWTETKEDNTNKVTISNIKVISRDNITTNIKDNSLVNKDSTNSVETNSNSILTKDTKDSNNTNNPNNSNNVDHSNRINSSPT